MLVVFLYHIFSFVDKVLKSFSLMTQRFRNLENTRIPTLKDLVIQICGMTDLKDNCS